MIRIHPTLLICLSGTLHHSLALAEEQPLQLKDSPSSQTATTTDIIDIFNPLPLPEPVKWEIPGLIILGLLIIAGLLFFILKKKKKSSPPPPPHEVALTDLKEARELIRQQHSLRYAERASGILRTYLENRFHIKSTRQTTEEFLQTIPLSSTLELKNYQDQLSSCLIHCDMAKYAHKKSDISTMEKIEKSITEFIENTAGGE